MKKLLLVLALFASLGLAQLSPSDVFTMRHLNTTVNDSGDGNFLFVNNEYEIEWNISSTAPKFRIYNNTKQVMRLSWSDSAIVLPDGKTSSVIPETASWATRNNLFPPMLIPPQAAIENTFYPLSALSFNEDLLIKPVFNTPVMSKISFRVFMSIEILGKKSLREFTFYGKPKPVTSAPIVVTPSKPIIVTKPVVLPVKPTISEFFMKDVPFFSITELVRLLSSPFASATKEGKRIYVVVGDYSATFEIGNQSVIAGFNGSNSEVLLEYAPVLHSSGTVIVSADAFSLFGCNWVDPPNIRVIRLSCGGLITDLKRY